MILETYITILQFWLLHNKKVLWFYIITESLLSFYLKQVNLEKYKYNLKPKKFVEKIEHEITDIFRHYSCYLSLTL